MVIGKNTHIGVGASLYVHPTLHVVTLEARLHHVQHSHLQRLKVHRLVVLVGPHTRDLLCRVPDLLFADEKGMRR